MERFGRADHARYYGDDSEDRLLTAGFNVSTSSLTNVFSYDVLKTIGAWDEEFWLGTAGADGKRFLEADRASAEMIDAMLPGKVRTEGPEVTIDGFACRQLALIDLVEDFSDTSAEAAEWESRYLWLTSRMMVKVGLGLKKLARDATRAASDRLRPSRQK